MLRRDSGFTLLELQLVCVIIGVLSMVLVPRVFGASDRARIAAAVADGQAFREALSIYEVDYGRFPVASRNHVFRLAEDLQDPDGQAYMTYPTGENFSDFRYRSSLGGQRYVLLVTANDRHSTVIEIDLNGVDILP